MTDFAVNEEKNKWLKNKMEELNVLEKDIEEKFIRGTGRGGQKVNKTSSSVYLKHIPTGIEVKCMKERSQSVNRFLARRELIQKIEKLAGLTTKEDTKREKAKKQKARRRRRSAKKHQSDA
jgi:protein subunit release factor B